MGNCSLLLDDASSYTNVEVISMLLMLLVDGSYNCTYKCKLKICKLKSNFVLRNKAIERSSVIISFSEIYQKSFFF